MTCRVALALLAPWLILGACGNGVGSGDDSEWGPLAVSPSPPNDLESLTFGTLEISEHCVMLNGNLLVWSAEATSWDPESRTIEYRHREGDVELSDGDRAAFGGSAVPIEENGSAKQWARSAEWVAEPHPSCFPNDSAWFVGAPTEWPEWADS